MDREMKRKRFENEEEAIEGKRANRNYDGGETAAAKDLGSGNCDGEVEEFYAILRRIYVAVKYFERSKSGSGSGDDKKGSSAIAATAKASASATPWSPNFRREDFGGGDGDGNGVKRGAETVRDSVRLDLNVKPDPVDEKEN